MRRSTLALCALLLLSSVAVPGLGSPQPTPVCGACGAGFELALEREGVDATVTASTADIRVREDDSATWRVTNHLANASTANRLRNDSATLSQAVEYALRRSAVDGPLANVSARVENETVVITFEDRYATTETPGGVQLLTYFHTRGHDTWHVVTADRISVVGPEGTVVSNDPSGATVRGRNATWHGDASAELWDAPRLDEDAYVAFAEPGAAASTLTALGAALLTLPIVSDVLGGIHLPALVLFGLTLAGSSVGARALRGRAGSTVVPAATVTLGLAALGWLALGGSSAPASETGALAVGVGGAAFGMGGLAVAADGRPSPGRLAGAGVFGLLVAAAVVAVSLPADYPVARAMALGGRVLLLLPLAVAALLGAAVTGGRRRTATTWWLLAVAGFFLGELAVVWPTQRPFGAVVLLLGVYALGIGLLALPFLLLGGGHAGAPE